MKTLTTIFLFSILMVQAFSNNNYEEAMKKGIDSLNRCHKAKDLQNIANYFERIEANESGKWLPGYYKIYCNVRTAFVLKDKEAKEELLNHTELAMEKLIEENESESEIFTLQGMLYQAYITLDPVNNGMVYSQKSNAAFQKAKKLNPNNPRPYYLEGLNILYSPEEFGGGKEQACPALLKANELFENFKPKNSLMPTWGKHHLEYLIKDCSY